MMHAVKTNVALTEQEDCIFGILKAAVKSQGLSVELRAAGGWVRDKLLGLESHDIDIALDMLGSEFAEHINRYLESQNKIPGTVRS